ncbi:MAG: T9SS type A sorting domain-containing protein, partial [Crocinitomicaceae bacterium]|nr:T9SS type A sorting domain-containing protein [Crocinitomicaceae bacterium]
SVLPVELSEFDAIYNPEVRGADLNWKTESEINNNFFTVQKSRNGINFEDLYEVKGAGTTNEITDYFAFDPNIKLGVTYYRLKQTDFDGKFEYSEVSAISVYDDKIDKLTISPNPTGNTTNIFFNSYQVGPSVLNIMNAQGQIIKSIDFTLKKNGNNIVVDMSSYAQGIYMVSVETNNKIYTGKIIKK